MYICGYFVASVESVEYLLKIKQKQILIHRLYMEYRRQRPKTSERERVRTYEWEADVQALIVLTF